MQSCPNCRAPLEADALACSACGADFGPGSIWKPGAVAPVEPKSTVYYWGKAILYPAYVLLVIAWLASALGTRKSGLAILIGTYASFFLVPAILLGHAFVSRGRNGKKA